MSGAFKVVGAGAHTTLQDFGRFGYQRFGLPVAGALDPENLRLANALVGNAGETAALEILVLGPTLEVETESAWVAFAGPGFEVVGEERVRVPGYRSHLVRAGEQIRIGGLTDSQCGYLAVAGGFAAEPVLGSLSTYARARIGGFDGRPLASGDILPLRRETADEGPEHHLPRPPEAGLDRPVRIVPGPQEASFTDAALEALVSEAFAVSRESDRMGMRLDGPLLEHREGFNIVSDGIVTGSIQVPGSGQPIVLLADHQTTGGYPKIATVISADVPLIGRRASGREVRFEAVSLDAAAEACHAREEALSAMVAAIEEAPPREGMDLDCLYTGNLISGVVNAWD